MKSSEKILPYIIGGLLLLAILVANLSVLFRYLFESPFTWSDEFLRYLFIWVVFVGAALSYKNDELIDMSMITDMLKSQRATQSIEIFRHFCSLILIFVITWQGLDIMLGQLRTGEVSTSMEVPIWLVTFSLVFSGIIWIAFAGEKVFKAVKKWDKNNGEEVQI